MSTIKYTIPTTKQVKGNVNRSIRQANKKYQQLLNATQDYRSAYIVFLRDVHNMSFLGMEKMGVFGLADDRIKFIYYETKKKLKGGVK